MTKVIYFPLLDVYCCCCSFVLFPHTLYDLGDSNIVLPVRIDCLFMTYHPITKGRVGPCHLVHLACQSMARFLYATRTHETYIILKKIQFFIYTFPLFGTAQTACIIVTSN